MKLGLVHMLLVTFIATMSPQLEAAAPPAAKAAQTKALLQLKAVLAPKVVIKNGWKEGTDFCKWTNIEGNLFSTLYIGCDDSSGLVTDLGAANIEDTTVSLPEWNGRLDAVPESVWRALAPSLTSINLYKTAVTGAVPAALSVLTRLEALDLSFTTLTGQLPDAWGALTALRTLSLYDTPAITGTLPASWSKMMSLTTLTMGSSSVCKVTGPLPSAWSSMRMLGQLQLTNCKLTGTLPAAWGALSYIQGLYISNNQLSGTLPDAWKTLGAKLVADNPCAGISIDLSNNRLAGKLPDSWPQINLSYLELRNNSFSGTLPKSWLQFMDKNKSPCVDGFDVGQIKVGRQQLTGSIPSFFL